MIPVEYELLDRDTETALEARVGPAGKWGETRDFQLKLLHELGLRPEMTLVDLGCGTLRAGLQLIGYLERERYIGIDVDPDSIRSGKKLVRQFQLGRRLPRLVHSVTFGENEAVGRGIADRIWCYQVMVHMSKGTVQDCFDGMARLLKPGGKAWASLRIRNGDLAFEVTGKWRSFPISHGTSTFYRRGAERAGLEYAELGKLGDFGLPAARNGANATLIELSKP
jgi:SAM-dependent methyltransferase